MIHIPDDPGDVLATARGFFAGKLILTAAELDLFSRLPQTAERLAEENGWDAEALTVLLDALAAIGLLDKHEARYAVRDKLTDGLGDNPEKSVVPMLKHMVGLWERWSALADIIRDGRGAARRASVFSDAASMRAFIGAMHVVGRQLAGDIVPWLDPSWATRLLDVGGASGTYTLAFLNHAPGLHATLFDRPDVIPLAEERLRQNGLLDRVRLVAGDYNADEFPGGHDLVWLSAIIHQNSRAENRALFAKCERALLPGGRVWIRDHFMDESRTRPPAGAIFAVNMLVATADGSTYTFAETAEDLEAAGLRSVRLIREGENMDAVVEAIKPE